MTAGTCSDRYEAAQIDVAQIGATCQTLNVSGTPSGLSAAFRVDYGPVPFTITEIYTAATFQGGFTKHAKMPGGSLLQLPSVVVDVTPSTLILFSCVDAPLVGDVAELVLATRSPQPSPAAVHRELQLAKALGVPFSAADVKSVDHSKCKAQ